VCRSQNEKSVTDGEHLSSRAFCETSAITADRENVSTRSILNRKANRN